MNQITIFTYENANILGYKDTTNALKLHCKGGGKTPPP